mmetsp:Transcript_1305/g.1634  ORF Transcript_1305/g.1634 Transcript_1305/m.1634 type:complete len:109 (-) Transcript_1305:17-343(-)
MYAIIDEEVEATSFKEIVAEVLGEEVLNAAPLDYEALLDEVFAANQKTIKKFLKAANKPEKKGKKKGKGQGQVMFFVGQVMRLTNKQGNPQEIEKLVSARLEKIKNEA